MCFCFCIKKIINHCIWTGHACVNQKLVFHYAAQKCLLDIGLLCESGVTETLVSLVSVCEPRNC